MDAFMLSIIYTSVNYVMYNNSSIFLVNCFGCTDFELYP